MTTSEASKGTGAPRADDDPVETVEWLKSIDAVVRYRGPERALFLVQKLESRRSATRAFRRFGRPIPPIAIRSR